MHLLDARGGSGRYANFAVILAQQRGHIATVTSGEGYHDHVTVVGSLDGLNDVAGEPDEANDKDNSQEDGYLTMSEIAELDLKADLVVLSACETGVGKVYTGDGIVGLNQAFMIAGANGLVVSLWPVDDKSTSIFMNRFYYNISRDMPYHTAISETKRAFISGLYGEDYKDPYYWAPFVYYGK